VIVVEAAGAGDEGRASSSVDALAAVRRRLEGKRYEAAEDEETTWEGTRNPNDVRVVRGWWLQRGVLLVVVDEKAPPLPTTCDGRRASAPPRRSNVMATRRTATRLDQERVCLFITSLSGSIRTRYVVDPSWVDVDSSE
jgi:hypothetical protein